MVYLRCVICAKNVIYAFGGFWGVGEAKNTALYEILVTNFTIRKDLLEKYKSVGLAA